MDAASANAISGGITAFGRGLDMGNAMVRMREKKKERDQIEYDRAFDERMVTAVTTMESSGDTTEAVKHLRELQVKSGIKEDSPTWIKAATYDQKTGALKIQKNDGSIVEAPRQEWDRWFPRTKAGTTSSLDATTSGSKQRKPGGIPSESEPEIDPREDPANPLNKERTESQVRKYLDTYFDLEASPADAAKAVQGWIWNQGKGVYTDPAEIARVYPGLKPRPALVAQKIREQRGLADDQPLPKPSGSPPGKAKTAPAASTVGVPSATTSASAPPASPSTSTQPSADKIQKWTAAYQKAQQDLNSTDPAAKAKAQAWLNSDTGKRIKAILDQQAGNDVARQAKEY